jgi:anti-sigma regulatory factor (Ser/Thr protein kinase)
MPTMTDIAAAMTPTTVLNGHRQPALEPVELKLRVLNSSVGSARRSITAILAGLVPASHLDDVELCASELVTNALAAAERYAQVMQSGWSYLDTPIHLRVLAAARWTRLDVRDPEPYMLPAKPTDPLDEHGRGLTIVQAFGHLAHTIGSGHKVVHAVIPCGVKLTDDELAAAFPAGATR